MKEVIGCVAMVAAVFVLAFGIVECDKAVKLGDGVVEQCAVDRRVIRRGVIFEAQLYACGDMCFWKTMATSGDKERMIELCKN